MTAPASATEEARFAQARALFQRGVAAFEGGAAAEAEGHFLASLALLPGRPSTLTNLAAARLHLQRPADALRAAEDALAAAPDDARAWQLRAQALSGLDRPREASDALRRHLELAPDQLQAWLQQAQWQLDLQQPEAALAACQRALALDATQAVAWTNSGLILKDLGRLEEAAQAFRNALAHGGDADMNGWYLAAVTGQAMPQQAPAGYIQGLFDGYSEGFERHLVETLRYQAHAALIARLRALPGRWFTRALDLGCGTGLCAPLLQGMTATIDGVDLSERMVEVARAKGLYEQVAQDDAVHFLRTTPHRYELVVATDVFIYIGDLDPVFEGAARVLTGGGLFAFSVEQPDDDAAPNAPQLRGSLRYAHPASYLCEVAARHGFTVECLWHDRLREEQGRPIAGTYVILGR